MEILCERPETMTFADYKTHLPEQKYFIKNRAIPISKEDMKGRISKGIKRQGKKA